MMTVTIAAVAYNPQFNVVRVDDSVPNGAFTSAARYKMTDMLIHERDWSEWNVKLSNIIEALDNTAKFVGGKNSVECLVTPELTPSRDKGVRCVTPWLGVSAVIMIHDIDTELDDTIAEHFFSLIYKHEMQKGHQPAKADDTSPGFGLRGIQFPIPLSDLSL